MWKELYNGTGRMIHFIIRRDRIRFLIWIVSLTVLTALTATSFSGMYQSDQERQAMAETMKNPAMTAMVGPGYGLDNYTEGPMLAHQMLLFTAIVVAIMSILLVTRHTRTDEEEGRIELIRSLPVGRLSNVTATIIVLVFLNVVLALSISISLYSLQIESMDLNGSLLYGAALGATGLFFTATTALFAQLSGNSRGTIGLSFSLLGIAYLLRAVGDVSNETLSWFSPLGWIVGTEVYVTNYWWPIFVAIGATILIIVVALYLNTIRDLDAGFLPAKAGRCYASPFLQGPLGLAFRIQKTGIISWAIGMFILGASYGSVMNDIESFFANNEMMSQMLTSVEGFTLTEQFLSMLMSVIAMICTVPAIMLMLKLKGEENKNRSEHLLARAVSRYRVIGSYLVLSLFFGFVMLFVALLGLWSAATSVMEDPISFGLLFKAAMVYLPAIWVMIGLTVLMVGVYPKLSGVAWLYLGYSFLVVYLGGMLQLPKWMEKISPYGYVPQIPVDEINYGTLLLLAVISFFLILFGMFGYRRRDIIG